MQTELSQRLWDEYNWACAQSSDINFHLPVLKSFADQCGTVTEFGVRSGMSSRAFLVSNAQTLRMYDLVLDGGVAQLVEFCANRGRDVIYQAADTLALEPQPSDMLFVDTLHTYHQLQAELARHGSSVNKFIAFHDTQTFGTVDETQNGPGLVPAMLEWLAANPEWRVVYHTYINNGLTVLGRVS
jgi:hypothetical protein